MISNRTKPLETRRCPKCVKDHPATLFNNLGFCVYCAQSQAQQQVPDSLKTRVEGLADDPLKAKRREHLRIQANKAKALAKIEARKQAKEAENGELDAAEAARQEMARRELAKTHLLPFILRFNDKYEPGWVHKDICDKLEWFSAAVAARESPRLMIFMPPRHGKSEIGSRSARYWAGKRRSCTFPCAALAPLHRPSLRLADVEAQARPAGLRFCPWPGPGV